MPKLSPTLIGHFVFVCVYLLLKTLRVQIVKHSTVDLRKAGVYCFWHNMHIAPILFAKHMQTGVGGLVSPSKDGDILATLLKDLGYQVIRGSSSRKGINGVTKLMQAIQEGCSFGIALDGPRGPIYQAKSGAAYISTKTGAPMVPFGAAYTRKFVFKKSWDKFQIPLPFSKVAICIGEPIYASESEPVEAWNEKIKVATDSMQQQALRVLKSPHGERLSVTDSVDV